MKRTTDGRASEKGFVLVTLYMLLGLLVVLGAVMVTRAIAEVRSAQRSQAGIQAWYLAEAGVDRAIQQLRLDFLWDNGYVNQALGSTGAYSVQVQDLPNSRKRLTAQGTSNLMLNSIRRGIEVVVQQRIPPNFYDNVIWAAQNLDFRGNSYQVDGNIIHADTTPPDTRRVNGTVTYDAEANPLPLLAFQRLYEIAQAQGNVYDAARLAGGPDVFPHSFWYRPPTDPRDPTTGIPNVNYITASELVLNGNIGTIGGFFVVVGDILNNPSAAATVSTTNGNGQVAGAIYTTGDYLVNGGGNRLNIDGGVWAGNEARLNGNPTLSYNRDYMDAIRALGITGQVQVLSWKDQ